MLRLTPLNLLRFSQASRFDVTHGGGESNVAASLANFGVPVQYVTSLLQNDIGDCTLKELRKRGDGTDHIIS
jgi:2-dehydro-3-deoxygluconokinase